MADVSVIIPAYNPGPYLGVAVQSVIDQTFHSWEMIVVDDGSTEDISYIAAKHPAIKLIRQENRGLSIARNTGILHASGNLLAFLDADDVWAPTKLEAQVQAIAEDEAVGLCHTQADLINPEGVRIRPSFTKAVDSYTELLKQCTICVSSVMIRRECLNVSGLFDPLYVSVQDYDMWLKIAPHYKFAFIPTPLTLYRVHSHSMSRNYLMVCEEVTSLQKRHIQIAHKRKDMAALTAAQLGLRQVRVGYGCQAFDNCRASLRSRDWKDSLAHLKHAFRLAPGYTTRSLLSYATGKRGQ